MKLTALLTAGLALFTLPGAMAQNETASDMAKAAYAAGYKALFTCSATFIADQSQAVINANELDGIYVDYRPFMSNLSDPIINERKKAVSVRFDRSLPPRMAVWRSGMGCALLPIGAKPDGADWLQTYAGLSANTARDISTALGDNVLLTDNTIALERLEAPVSFAFDGTTYGEGTRTSAVVITHKGEVIAEQYGRGVGADTPQRTWSVAKSLTATVIGAALQDGLVGLDNTAIIDEFNHGADPRRDITLRNVLHMASGLDSGHRGSRTDEIYFGGVRVMDMIAPRLVEARPGVRFKYSNYDTLIAMRYLREAIGDDPQYHRYPYNAVLNKIGALSTILETDWDGDFLSSSQVWMTARDMARLGQLYLQGGKWGDEQILHPDWVDFVTTPAPAQPESGDFAYGGSFWLLSDSAGVPEDAYAALGNRGQAIVIVPSHDLVIVRRGYDVAGEARFDIAAFTRNIVAVMDRIEAEKIAAALAETMAEAED
ncbi:MAG: serine hydrolase [Henriciella sp.]|nr:serine hydrolase [Henriciella sp.]